MDTFTLSLGAIITLWVVGIIISIGIQWAIIRGAMLSALRKHSEEQLKSLVNVRATSEYSKEINGELLFLTLDSDAPSSDNPTYVWEDENGTPRQPATPEDLKEARRKGHVLE